MVKINSLCKKLNNNTIISNLSLELNDGSITALVGKNGCGKTTLVRLISGILKADSGNIYINKDDSIGVLLGGDVSLYNKLTGFENIEYFAKMRGMSRVQIKNRCDELAELLNFKPYMHQKTEYYSRGMKQRIAFAIAVMHNPKILLLDEPSTGLDIGTSMDVIKLIKLCKVENRTVLISTHHITEIFYLSDYIAIMQDGRITEHVNNEIFFKGLNIEKGLEKLISLIY